jgi:hypothetical protein
MVHASQPNSPDRELPAAHNPGCWDAPGEINSEISVDLTMSRSHPHPISPHTTTNEDLRTKLEERNMLVKCVVEGVKSELGNQAKAQNREDNAYQFSILGLLLASSTFLFKVDPKGDAECRGNTFLLVAIWIILLMVITTSCFSAKDLACMHLHVQTHVSHLSDHRHRFVDCRCVYARRRQDIPDTWEFQRSKVQELGFVSENYLHPNRKY